MQAVDPITLATKPGVAEMTRQELEQLSKAELTGLVFGGRPWPSREGDRRLTGEPPGALGRYLTHTTSTAHCTGSPRSLASLRKELRRR
jgi:hypothetical protein